MSRLRTGFQRFLGQVGKVKRSDGDHVEVCFNNWEALGLAPRKLPVKLLEKVTLPLNPAPPLKTMVRQSRALKQSLLESGEVLDPEIDVSSPLKVGSQAADDQTARFGR